MWLRHSTLHRGSLCIRHSLCLCPLLPRFSEEPSIALDLIRKFVKLHIDINMPKADYEFLRGYLVELSTLLSKKSVQVKFINPIQTGNAKMIKEAVPDLMLIRCKQLNILNTGISASQVSKVTTIATSNRPILDLYGIYNMIYQYSATICSICEPNGAGFSPVHCSEVNWWDIWDALDERNTKAFFWCRDEILETIDEDRADQEERERKQEEEKRQFRLEERESVFLDDVKLDEDGLPTEVNEAHSEDNKDTEDTEDTEDTDGADDTDEIED